MKGIHSKWMNTCWWAVAWRHAYRVEEAGRVLQSSLAQGYSMSQTIPGQRLHAVMEHGWHVSGSNGSQSRVDGWACIRPYTHSRTLTHTGQKTWRAEAQLRRVRMRSSVSQPSLSQWSCMPDGTQRIRYERQWYKCIQMQYNWSKKHWTCHVYDLGKKACSWSQHKNVQKYIKTIDCMKIDDESPLPPTILKLSQKSVMMLHTLFHSIKTWLTFILDHVPSAPMEEDGLYCSTTPGGFTFGSFHDVHLYKCYRSKRISVKSIND